MLGKKKKISMKGVLKMILTRTQKEKRRAVEKLSRFREYINYHKQKKDLEGDSENIRESLLLFKGVGEKLPQFQQARPQPPRAMQARCLESWS